MPGKWTEKKSKALFALFQEWLENEFDLETLSLTKNMISAREMKIKKAMDVYKKKQVKGFRR